MNIGLDIAGNAIANGTPLLKGRGLADGKSDILDAIRAELIDAIQNGTLKIENGHNILFRIIDKYKAESKDEKWIESED